ncbi:MAG: branched-chain amino acid aminotransferase [Bacteroidetes bacterium]|nr:branched-chain amino acid aminotransferase [Bacteroidota bacterium]
MPHNITIQKTEKSRISEVDFNNIGFGKVFSDHMFLTDWDGQEWTNPRIVPYANLSLSPATSAIHYGQAIFEGMKAFRNGDAVFLFRLRDNWRRLNISADRMVMPEVPESLFTEGLKTLLSIDKMWVPGSEGSALYIRPFMFATDDFIGVKPSEKYCFCIFTCPVGPYYSKPLRIKVEEKYSRAAQGGVGFTKCAGNYGAAMYPTKLAQSEGFDQVLWTDPSTHTLVEETGTTNFFAVTGDGVITPNLHETMLAGITRDSVIQLLKKENIQVEERPLTVSELKSLHTEGNLKELFISGTAATLINIEGFSHQGNYFDVMKSGNTILSDMVRSQLDGIRHGNIADSFGWIENI